MIDIEDARAIAHDVTLLNGAKHRCLDPIALLELPYIEVVRCRDCRWYEREQPGMVYCPLIVGNWVEEGWFCADGERREG